MAHGDPTEQRMSGERGADGARDPGEPSELEQGIEQVGRVVGGVLTQLVGSRYTKVELDPDKPVLGAEADETVKRVGSTLGRWLLATGEGLKNNPTDPIAALEHVSQHHDVDPELREGEAPLAAGARVLASGVKRSTEALLDAVAPRKSKPEPPPGDGEGEG
jgi:hypothetical protein